MVKAWVLLYVKNVLSEYLTFDKCGRCLNNNAVSTGG